MIKEFWYKPCGSEAENVDKLDNDVGYERHHTNNGCYPMDLCYQIQGAKYFHRGQWC